MEGGSSDFAAAMVLWKECLPTASDESVFGASPSTVAFNVVLGASVEAKMRQKVPFSRLMSIFLA